MMATTNTMMSPEAAAEVAARTLADAKAEDSLFEEMNLAMDGAMNSDPPPQAPSQDGSDLDTAEEQAAEQAAEARSAAINAGLTHARVGELNDRVGALTIDANAAKSSFYMRRLAKTGDDMMDMLESYDVKNAKMRGEYGKVVESGIKHLKIADLYESDFRPSETPEALKTLQESHSALKILGKEMKNQQVTAAALAQGAVPVDPTAASVQARWDLLSEAQRATRECAADRAMGAFDERITRAEKNQTKYRKSIKYLEEHFGERGGYLKSVALTNAILSGTVAPRPDPELSREATDDQHAAYVKLGNEAQALADEAAASRNRLQPGSDAYFAALQEVKQLGLAVAEVDAAKPCAPPAGATNEEAAAAHFATRAWQDAKDEATIQAGAARDAMYRLYLSNEARRVGADFDACAAKYANAVAACTYYGDQGDAVRASMAERDARSLLSDQWMRADAKWRSCHSDVQLWTSMAEKLRPKRNVNPVPLTLRQKHSESVQRELAPCLGFKVLEPWERGVPLNDSTADWRARSGNEASTEAPTEEREPTPLDVGVAALNRQREATKANYEAALQMRVQLVDQAKRANRVLVEKKAAAARLCAAEAQAKQQAYKDNRGTIVGFEQLTRDIIGEVSRSALSKIPTCCAGKRKNKNKMEATMEQPAGGDRMVVQGAPGQVNWAKRAKSI